MPGTNEQVNYSYTGDVSSLKKATKDALGFLNQYQAEIARLTNLDAFGKNAKASSSFQTAIKNTTKVVQQLESKLKDVSSVKAPAYTADLTSTMSSLSNVSKVYNTLKSSTQLTTKEVRGLTTQLKEAQVGLKSSGTDVDALVAKEVKFQNTLTALRGKSEQFKSTLEGMKNSISSTFNPLLTKLNSLRNPLANLPAPLQSFKDKTKEAFGRVKQMADAVSSAFRRVKQSEDDAANSAATSSSKHQSLDKDISKLSGDVNKETENLKKESDTLKSKEKQVTKSSSGHKKFSTVVVALTSAIKKELAGLKNLGNGFKSLVSSITGSNNVVSKFKHLITSLGLVEAANQSIKYAENLNLFNVAMGTAAEKGHAFINQMQELYGMDPSNLLRYAGNFYQLADAIKMPDEAAANMSLSLTKAANDIASLFNVNVETVFENLSSGMQGMTRAVRKYGIDIRNVTLQQTALNYGITDNVDIMSEANRQALRFLTIMDQTKNATSQLTEGVDGTTKTVGDFANTIEQPANQLRIFKEQISQLGRAIGDLFVVPLRNALQYINGFIMALRIAITFIGSLIGSLNGLGGTTSGLGDAAEGVDQIGNSADKASKKLKKFLAPFDELNVVSKDAGSGSGGTDTGTLDPKLQAAIANMSLGLDDVRMKANEVRDALLGFFGFEVDAGKIISWDASTFEANLIAKFPKWTATIQAVFANWGNIVNGFKKLMESLGVVAETTWSKISGFVSGFVNDGTASTFISDLGKSLDDFSKVLNDNADVIADFIVALPVLIAGFKAMTSVVSIISSVSTALANVSSSGAALLSTLGPIVGWIAAIVAAIALLYFNSSSFAESFNTLLTSLWTGLQPILVNIQSLFITIWTSLQMLWAEHVQPMLESTGNALAPVLDTITSLWNNCSVIIADFISILESAWIEIIEPVFAAICDIVADVAGWFQVLWEEFLGPIIEEIGNSVQNMWTRYLKPIIDKVIAIVSDVIDIIMFLWHTVLEPIVDFLIDVLAPIFKSVFQAIWAAIEWALNLIFNIIDVLLGVFAGVTGFLSGIFTGDWKKALSSLLNIFVSLGNGIIGVMEDTANFVIKIINSMLSFLSDGVKGLINGMAGMVEDIADFLGYDIDLSVTWKTPKIPSVSIPRIPTVALASGGVVTSPTYSMIGEGRYDEAVIPLGNSPQMKDLVSQIAEAVKGGNSDDEMVPVQVYMDGDLFFETMARKNRDATIRTGINPMMGG